VEMAGLVGSALERATLSLLEADLQLSEAVISADDAVDRLHRALFAVLLAPQNPCPIETAVDVTLLGRYYKRFADHAVKVADRLIFLVTGEK
jgi:phosphate transport system protein